MNIQETVDMLETPAFKREHFEVELDQVKILKPDVVDISGDSYALTKSGTKSLCKLLEVPSKFYEQLNTDDEVLWETMVHRLEELKNSTVRFATGKGDEGQFISSFNKSSVAWIGNDIFLEIVQNILSKNTDISLKRLFITKHGINARLIYNKTEVGLKNAPQDIFKMAVDLFNSEELFRNTRIGLSLERLVCSNGAMTSEKEAFQVLSHKQASQNLVAELYESTSKLVGKSNWLEQTIRNKIDGMVESNASLRELESAYYICNKVADKLSDRVSEVDKMIPLKAIAAKYGLELPIARSDRWKTIAQTPVNLYQLYNDVTYLASNQVEVTDDEKIKMQIEIGKVFLKDSPDLIDVAPLITNWN